MKRDLPADVTDVEAKPVAQAGPGWSPAPDTALVVTPHPMTTRGQQVLSTLQAELLPGDTLALFVGRHGVLPGQQWLVSIGGVYVPESMWVRVWPKHGHLIECRRVPQKEVLQIVAIAALSYFTLGAGGFAAGGFLGLTGAAGFIAATGAYLAGSLVINKLLGPKPVSRPNGATNNAVSPTYSLSGGRNRARQFEPMGLVLGEPYAVPDMAAQPYSYFADGEQYLWQIYHCGINCDSVRALRVGQTSIDTYQGVTVSKEGFGTDNTGLPKLGTSVDTIAGALLDAPTGDFGPYVVRTTSVGTIRIAVDLVANVYGVNNDGGFTARQVDLTVQYRAVGGDAWLGFMEPTAGVAEVTEEVELFETIDSNPFSVKSTRIITPGVAAVPAEVLQIVGSSTKPVRRTIERQVPAGQYEVRLQKRHANYEGTQGANSVEWSSLKSFQADNGYYSGQARLGVQIKASGQLNGQLDELNVQLRARPMPHWDGTAYVQATTRENGLANPGSILLLLARGLYDDTGRLMAGLGFADEQIDFDSLKQFTVRCTEKNFTFDYFLQESTSIGDLMDAVAAAGMGSTAWPDGKLGVVWFAEDQPVEGVINMTTMKAKSFSVEYDTQATADEIVYEYFDRARNDTWQSLRVKAPGVTHPTSTARTPLTGVTTEAHAAVLARFSMAQNAYQRKTVNCEVDIEHMTFKRGTVMVLSHDLTQWGYGGRLQAAMNNAGYLTLTLDDLVPAQAPSGATSRFIGIRLAGERQYRVFAINTFEGSTRTVTLTDAWPANVPVPGDSSANPAHDAVWIYDFKQTPGQKLRVAGVSPTGNMSGARVMLVPESAEFWNYVFTGEYSPPPNNSLLQGVPTVTRAVVTEQLGQQADTWFVDLTLTFKVSGSYASADLYGSLSDGPREYLGSTRALSITWRAAQGDVWTLELQIYGDTRKGEPYLLRHTTVGQNKRPTNYDTFAVIDLAGGLRRFNFDYTVNSKPSDLAGAMIRYTAGNVTTPDWGTMTPLTQGGFTAGGVELALPDAGSWTFALRAVNTAGLLAEVPRYAAVVLASSLPQLALAQVVKVDAIDGALALLTAGLDDAVADIVTTGQQLTGEVANRQQAVAAESVARAQAVAAQAQQLAVEVQNRAAALTAEAAARTAALSAEAVARSAAISSEQTARASDLATEAAARAAAISTEANQRWMADIAEASARAQQILTEQNARAQAILDEASARGSALLALSNEIASDLLAEATARGTDITAVNTLRQQGDDQLAGTLSTLTAAVTNDRQSAAAAIQSEASTRAAADIAEATQRTQLAARVTATEGVGSTNTASITAEQTARANGDQANAASILTLASTVQGNAGTAAAAVQSEAATRAAGDQAEATQRTALATRVTTAEGGISTNTAAITNEASARATGDTVNANAINTLTATVNNDRSNAMAAVQNEAAVRASAVSAEATQRETLAARVALAEGGISTNTAAITNEAAVRANAVETLAGQVSSLSASTRTRPNLCPDVGAWISSSGSSVIQDSWGKHRIAFGLPAGVHVWQSPSLPVQPGADYVIAGDSLLLFNAGGSGTVYFDLVFTNAAGMVVEDGFQHPIFEAHDYSNTGDTRQIHAVQAQAPNDAVAMLARFVVNGYTDTYAVGFRQVKVERGVLPATAYSSEFEVVSATAAIKTEAQARVDGDAAEAVQRNTLAAQMRGSYTGTDLGGVTTGLLHEERQARVTQDQALAQQITLLSAGAGEQFDYKKIFYFDTDAEGWTGFGGPVTASGGFLSCPLDQPGSNIVSPSGLGVEATRYSQVRLRIRKTGSPAWGGRFWWARTGDGDFNLASRSTPFDEPTYDVNGIGLITINPVWDGTIDRINFDFTGGQTSASNFKVDFVAIGRPSPGASSAELLDEKTARAAADLAEATSRQLLSSRLTGLADPANASLGSLSSGLLFEERQARSTQDGALATSISNLTATVGGNAATANAAVQTEAAARAAADAAEASQRNTLAASLVTRPNLCPDVDAWTLQPPCYVSFDAWGKTIRAINPSAGTYVCYGPTMPCYASQTYTITGDSLLYSAGGAVSFDLLFLDSAGNVLLDGPNGNVSSFHDHSNTNSNRLAHAVSCVAPAGAAQMVARFIAFDFNPGNLGFSAFGFRQVKVEQGGLPATVYTQEAQVQALNAAIVTERTARTNADSAFAQQTDAIVARANLDRNSTNAALLTEQTARADADSAASGRIDSLTATVNGNQTAALAAINSEASTRASQDQAAASRTDTLFAKLVASPNLCPDVDKWDLGPGFGVVTDGWGKSVRLSGAADGTYVCVSPAIACYAGQTYTVTGDSLRYMQSGGVAFDMFFLDANGNQLQYSQGIRSYSYHDHANDNSNRDFHAVALLAPATAVAVKVRFFVEGGVGIQAAGFRQVKLEQRGLPATFYTQEGELSTVNAAILTERTARVTADEAFTQLANSIIATANTDRGSAVAAVQSEQTARANADGAITTRLDTMVATANSDRGNTNAAIITEQNTRAGADQSLATQINQVVATANADRASSNAVIAEERSVRAGADNSLAQQISTLTSTVNTDRGNTNAAIVLEQNTRAGADQSLAGQINTVVATANTDRSSTQSLIQQANQARADGDGANASQINTVQARLFTRPNLCADVDRWILSPGFFVNAGTPWGKFAAGFGLANGTHVSASPTMDCYANTTYTVTGDSVRFCSAGAVYFDLEFFDANGATVLDGPQNFDTAYHDFSGSNFNRDGHAISVTSPGSAVRMRARFVAEGVTGVQAVGFRQVKVEQGGLPATNYTQEGAVDALNAAFVTEQVARVTADAAFAQRTDAIIATANTDRFNTGSAIVAEQTARANADNALTGQVNALTATVNNDRSNTAASIVAEQTARAGADSALSGQIGTLSATVNTDRGTAASAIVTEQTARANADAALGSQISTLTATVNGNTAAIQTESQVRAEQTGRLFAGYSLTLVAGGKIAGVRANVDSGTGSDLVFLFDRVAFAQTSNGTTVYPFTIGTINGVSSIGINANMYIDGSVKARMIGAGEVTADKITATELSAISGRMGNLSAGSVRGGAYQGYAWPDSNQGGYYLGPEGLLMGNIYSGKYLQVTADGDMYLPGLSVVNGTSRFSGMLEGATGNFSGALNGASGTFSGSLTADAINAVNTINIAGNAVSTTASAGSSGGLCSVNLYIPPYQTMRIVAIGYTGELVGSAQTTSQVIVFIHGQQAGSTVNFGFGSNPGESGPTVYSMSACTAVGQLDVTAGGGGASVTVSAQGNGNGTRIIAFGAIR